MADDDINKDDNNPGGDDNARALAEAQQSIDKLQRALDNERKQGKEFKDRFKDVDLEEYANLRKEAEEMKNKKMIDEGKYQELLQEHLGRQEKDFRSQLASRDETIADLNRQVEKFKIMEPASRAAIKNNVLPESAEYIEWMVSQRFKMEDGTPVGRDSNGELILTDSGEKASIERFVEKLRLDPKMSHHFQSAKGSGRTGERSGSRDIPNGAKQVLRTPENLDRYAQDIIDGKVVMVDSLPS